MLTSRRADICKRYPANAHSSHIIKMNFSSPRYTMWWLSSHYKLSLDATSWNKGITPSSPVVFVRKSLTGAYPLERLARLAFQNQSWRKPPISTVAVSKSRWPFKYGFVSGTPISCWLLLSFPRAEVMWTSNDHATAFYFCVCNFLRAFKILLALKSWKIHCTAVIQNSRDIWKKLQQAWNLTNWSTRLVASVINASHDCISLWSGSMSWMIC